MTKIKQKVPRVPHSNDFSIQMVPELVPRPVFHQETRHECHCNSCDHKPPHPLRPERSDGYHTDIKADLPIWINLKQLEYGWMLGAQHLFIVLWLPCLPFGHGYTAFTDRPAATAIPKLSWMLKAAANVRLELVMPGIPTGIPTGSTLN